MHLLNLQINKFVYLIFQILGTILTYLVVLMQFQPTSQSDGTNINAALANATKDIHRSLDYIIRSLQDLNESRSRERNRTF